MFYTTARRWRIGIDADSKINITTPNLDIDASTSVTISGPTTLSNTLTVSGDIQATSIINTTDADMVIDNQDTDKKIVMRLEQTQVRQDLRFRMIVLLPSLLLTALVLLL